MSKQMRTYVKVAAWLAVMTAVGCADTAAPSKPAAAPIIREGPSGASAAADAVNVPANGLPINPKNSKITFVGTKPDGKHDGGFTQFSGYVEKGPSGLAGGKVVVEIQVESLYSD